MTIVSPQWVRGTMCEDIADDCRKFGEMPNTRAIERVIDSDLQGYEARREKRKRKAQAASLVPKRTTAEKFETKKAMAAAQGYGITVAKPKPTPVLHSCRCMQCRICKMHIRVAALSQMKPGLQARKRDFFYPKFGELVATECIHYARKVGKYKTEDHDAVDRARVFVRAMEDICDQSTGILGHWWVK